MRSRSSLAFLKPRIVVTKDRCALRACHLAAPRERPLKPRPVMTVNLQRTIHSRKMCLRRIQKEPMRLIGSNGAKDEFVDGRIHTKESVK